MTPFDPDELATGLIRVRVDGGVEAINRAAADLLGIAAMPDAGWQLRDLAPVLDSAVERTRCGKGPLWLPEIQVTERGPAVDTYLHAHDDTVLIELHPVAVRVRQRQMADRADRQQAVTLLTRRLAHELRNPLAGVRGAAQLIGAADNSEAIDRHAAMIQREVDRIVALIDRFAGGGDSDRGPVNLHRVIDEAAELAGAEAGGRLRIERDFDASIPELQADGAGLHRLLVNLLRNAIQAGASSIRLTTRIEHDCPQLDDPHRAAVRIEIDDDGTGVPENLRQRLFLPLVSGRGDGTGFGLAIVQQIARAHGGLASYHPLDAGSRFQVYLPLIPAEVEADA